MIHHATEAVDVRSLVRRTTIDLFRRHVVRGAEPSAGARESSLVPCVRDAEIGQLCDALGGHQDVVRLDVTMDDAGAMGGTKTGGNVCGYLPNAFLG